MSLKHLKLSENRLEYLYNQLYNYIDSISEKNDCFCSFCNKNLVFSIDSVSPLIFYQKCFKNQEFIGNMVSFIKAKAITNNYWNIVIDILECSLYTYEEFNSYSEEIDKLILKNLNKKIGVDQSFETNTSTQCFFREDLYFKLTNYKNLLVHKSERYKYYLYILSKIHLKLFIQTKSENEIAEVYQNIENNMCKLILNHVSYNAVLFNKNVEIIDENREDSKINLDKFNQNSKLHIPSFVIRQLFLSDSILASGYHIKVKYLNGTFDSVPTISLEDSNNKEYKYILIKMTNYFDLKIKIENLPWEFNNNDEFVNEFKNKEFNLIFMFKTNNIIELSDVDWLRMKKKIR
ncbi:hypothetical protein CWI39_0590p0020 [Hamiltosporidium magnivora]|uniref:Uncharacterized protein n=1 Tax=Hamiltosporidium magnivora TaxID=148818 RepID=A0A4Q9LFP0_9MICR|nr:hypothetical protein CWI39_0590p0020 [Hamiltosporidium magnivora]